MSHIPSHYQQRIREMRDASAERCLYSINPSLQIVKNYAAMITRLDGDAGKILAPLASVWRRLQDAAGTNQSN